MGVTKRCQNIYGYWSKLLVEEAPDAISARWAEQDRINKGVEATPV